MDDEYGTCLKMTSSEVGSSNQRIYPSTTDNFIHKGGTYSLSFYAKTDSEDGAILQTNVAGGTDPAKNHTLTTSWQRFTFTYAAHSGSITFWLNEAEKTAYITKVQMERGDKVTDWKPAPDETVTTVDLNNKSSEINSSLEGLTSRISTSETLIQQLKDEISSLVVDENGASLMTQTGTGVQFSMGSIIGSVSDISELVDNLKNQSDETAAEVTSLQQAMNDIGTLTEHVKFDPYTYVDDDGVTHTEPSVQLYEDDSDFRHVITNTQAMYMDGANVSTRIDNEGVDTENISVKHEFRQDGWVWKTRSNGNYGLSWKG
jgi:chaperonin cofactor prefoldin